MSNLEEIPRAVNVSEQSQYIKQFNKQDDNINNQSLNNNKQINEHLAFNPLNYIPNQESVPLQEQQYMPMISPRYSNMGSVLQEGNTNIAPSSISTNDMMSNRIFNTDHLIQGSLVPINKHHHFSRNLFQEGVPIPHDLQPQNLNNNQLYMNNKRNQNVNQLQQQWAQQGYQNGHQFRAKTLYKDELNSRLQNLSPLGDRLYMPVDKQINTQQQLQANSVLNNMYQQSMVLSPEEQKRISLASNRGNRRDEMNARMGQYEPLASVMTTNKKNNISGFQPPMPTL
jgi:Na+-translocating ferredoxin:NAD+ oxidoreductase RnfG subunit